MDASGEMRRRHISDQPFLENPPCAPECGVISVLKHARNAELWVIGCGVDQRVSIVDARGDRLLAQHMLTCPDGVENDLGMCRSRCTDAHRVDVRTPEQLAVVGKSGVGTSPTPQGLGSRHVDVRNGGESRSAAGAEIRRCVSV
jgi:hypothetical protein